MSTHGISRRAAIAGIGQTSGQPVDQAAAPIDLAQQQAAGVGGQRTPGEIGLNLLASETGKQEPLSVTLCHAWPPCLGPGDL